MLSQCLKIWKEVSFNIASEASYVYILSGQKFIKNAQNIVNFGEFLKTWIFQSDSVTRQVNYDRTKMIKMPKLQTSFDLKRDIYGDFQILWLC